MTTSPQLVTRSRRVLVVEDDHDFAESLVDVLEPMGFSVHTARSKAEAVEALLVFAADIALIDIELGAENGVELVPELKAQRPALVCVLMTAYAALDSAVQAVRCGAADYLRKPLSPSDLLAKLEHMLEERERALRKQREQRLVLMGGICAGIAHDVNNCLQVMVNEVSEMDLSLKSEPPDVERARESLTVLDRSVHAVAGVCQRILAFAKGSAPSQSSDACAVLKSSAAVLAKLARPGVTLSLDAPDSALWVGLDSSQLQQVISNLVSNASYAVGHTGNVRVELSENPDLNLRSVLLRVLDDGCGIPEPVRGRIFDPYFSTKPSGEGMGLGLSIVYGMVSAVGGDIRVETEVGKGTTFDVILPLAENAGSSVKKPLRSLRARRLLIVDDFPAILRAIDKAFRAAGYETLCATTAEEALSLLAAQKEPPDGVISDVRLPGMSGIDLADQLLERMPTLPIILLSGDTGNIPGMDRFDGKVALLGKPFRLAALVERFEAM